MKNEGWVLFRDGFGVLSEEMKGFLWWKEEKELKMEGTTIVNSECRGYGMKLLRGSAMGEFRMGDDEGKDFVDGKE